MTNNVILGIIAFLVWAIRDPATLATMVVVVILLGISLTFAIRSEL